MKQVILFLIVLAFSSCDRSVEERRPNFIIIYTDDQQFMGAGVNGNPVILTPNMDSLSQRGLRFTNAHVAFSLCSPSRAALLTGRYGSQNGVLGLGSTLRPGEKVLSQYLKEEGYYTGLSGKWHIKPGPEKLGFDFYNYFFSNGTYYGRRVITERDTLYPSNHIDEYGVDQSITFLQEATRSGKPFFLFHCPQTPHMNGELVWDAKENTKILYDVDEMPVPQNRLDDLTGKPPYLQKVRNRMQAKVYGYPDENAIQVHTRDYYSVITELDGFLGKLFETISDLELWENTYLVFMSDNGWMLGDHGFTSKVLPYQVSTHVPFFIVGPDIKPGVTKALVSNLDIVPTLLELADINVPEIVHGESLKPLLNDREGEVRSHFIYEGLGSYGSSHYNLTVIDGDYRYIVTYTDSTLNEVEFTELYHYKLDAQELSNEASNPEYQEMVKRFDQQIVAHKNKILEQDQIL